MTTTDDRKALGSPPHVTAVVVRSGDFEATIGADSGITITRVGIRDGRTKVVTLTAHEAGRLLDLVAHGRAALEGMQDSA